MQQDPWLLFNKECIQQGQENWLHTHWHKNSNRLISSERSGIEEMAGKEWFWTIKPVKTDNDNFIQLVVSVYADEKDQESSIVSVTGLIDRFHKKR